MQSKKNVHTGMNLDHQNTMKEVGGWIAFATHDQVQVNIKYKLENVS